MLAIPSERAPGQTGRLNIETCAASWHERWLDIRSLSTPRSEQRPSGKTGVKTARKGNKDDRPEKVFSLKVLPPMDELYMDKPFPINVSNVVDCLACKPTRCFHGVYVTNKIK